MPQSIPFRILVLIAFFFGVFLAASPHALAQPPARGHRNKAAVLIEFFTSENCRRCWSAEDNLARLRETRAGRYPALQVLAFHVDYLDTAGDKDRYGKLGFSQRHFRYAEAFNQARAQAGEAVIDGKYAVSAFEPAKLERAIERAALVPSRAQITAEPQDLDKNRLGIRYSVKGLERAPRDFFYLQAALIEDGIETIIGSGPHAGEKATLQSVVRAFETARFSGRSAHGTLELYAPDDLKRARAAVVCFVQDPLTQQVVGVFRTALDQKQSKKQRPEDEAGQLPALQEQ